MIHPLEHQRQVRGLSYQDLADEIFEVTRHRRNQDCWRKIALRQTKTPHATTIWALKAYLAHRRRVERNEPAPAAVDLPARRMPKRAAAR